MNALVVFLTSGEEGVNIKSKEHHRQKRQTETRLDTVTVLIITNINFMKQNGSFILEKQYFNNSYYAVASAGRQGRRTSGIG
jgi:hypothetical protein